MIVDIEKVIGISVVSVRLVPPCHNRSITCLSGGCSYTRTLNIGRPSMLKTVDFREDILSYLVIRRGQKVKLFELTEDLIPHIRGRQRRIRFRARIMSDIADLVRSGKVVRYQRKGLFNILRISEKYAPDPVVIPLTEPLPEHDTPGSKPDECRSKYDGFIWW